MAEPFSLAVNVVQIISACTSTIKTIDHLVQNYLDAGAKLKSLAAKASLVKAVLKELEKTLKGRTSFFAQKIDDDSELKSAIDQTLTGCWTVFLLLQKELHKWVPKDGKDPSFLKKAGLIFQDEIIQDYRIQIEGHVEGLKTVLVCLQAQTVAETHETLQRANATLERIAKTTVNIREEHKEIAFPESVYEGYTTYEEDKPFDKELLTSSAYRAAFNSARKNTLTNGDASVITTSTRARQDFLSDQPADTDSMTLKGSNDLLNSDAVGDLIQLGDDSAWNENSATSPNAQLMAGLTWEPAHPHILDGENAEIQAQVLNQSMNGNRRSVLAAEPEVQIDDLLDDMLKDAAAHGAAPEQDPRRDSGHPMSHQGSSASSRKTRGSVPTIVQPNDGASSVRTRVTIVPAQRDEEGLIPCESEYDSTLGRTVSISTAGSRRLSSPTLGYFNLSVSSPTSQSPGIAQLPVDHRLSNPQDHIPQADEHLQESLLASMYPVIRSLDPTLQMNWAENVLEHLSVTISHEHRLASLNVRRKSVPAALSESEQTLRLEASRIVETLRKAGYGRAYFLSAKYIVHENEREHLHLLASGQNYHRSQFYLGQMAEKGDVVGDALRRYKAGEAFKDAACLHRLSQVHFQGGQLGIKKNKEEGLRLLREAAKHADKDYPEPLYDLAILLLTPPSKTLGISSKPLVQRDVAEARLLLHEAAFLGHGPSQLRLGQAHRCGYFDPKDAKKAENAAAKLTRTSSNKFVRRKSSATSASTPPPTSTDAEVNSTLAMHYLHLAARRGQPQADYEIAHELLFKAGELSPQHQRLAYAHTARALLGKVPLAYGLMGKCLEDGIGCKKNLVEAEEFYFRGRQEGDDWARARSDYLLNQEGVGVSAGTSDTYKKPTHADQKVAARSYWMAAV